MHLWISKPCVELTNQEDGRDLKCSSTDQHKACADIIAYHMKEHLAKGAVPCVGLVEAPEENSKDLAGAIRSVIEAGYVHIFVLPHRKLLYVLTTNPYMQPDFYS